MTAAAKVTANGYNIYFFKSLSSPNYRLWVVAELKMLCFVSLMFSSVWQPFVGLLFSRPSLLIKFW